MTHVCAFPKCFTTISSKTVTGLCREHNHAVGLCRCSKCRISQKRDQEEPARAGTQVTLVNRSTATSKSRSYVPVRLAKVPSWE